MMGDDTTNPDGLASTNRTIVVRGDDLALDEATVCCAA